jgi:orotate phosphoribosyltransferase
VNEREELARTIWDRSHLTGSFRLRSGAQSSEYFDKYRFESDPALLKAICAAMLPLVPSGVGVLAGLELGGVPIATLLGQMSGLPMVLVRKSAKPYGTCQLAEGIDVLGRNLLIVEDVVTSGGQVAQSASDLRRLGAQVERAVCVIDRRSAGATVLESAGITLTALFTYEQLSAFADSGLSKA